MRILSIDQSFTKCAWCIIENSKLELAGVIKTATGENSVDNMKRAWDIAMGLKTIAESNQIDLCVLEGLAFSNRTNGNSNRDLAGLQYVIGCVLLKICNIELKLVAPKSVKKVATGNGNSSKDEVYDALPQDVDEYFRKLGFKKSTGLKDLSDAYWIGITGEQ